MNEAILSFMALKNFNIYIIHLMQVKIYIFNSQLSAYKKLKSNSKNISASKRKSITIYL